MTKATIYTRISKDDTGEGLGVSRQLEDCRKLAEQRGWTVVAEHSDNDTSAAGRRKRPAFEAVLRAVESGEAQVVVAWSFDRLTRNRRDQVRIIEAGQEAKATIALVRGTDLDLSTASGRWFADSLASLARVEIEIKSERHKRANDQAAAKGLRTGGRRPFGYTLDMRPLEPEAQAVRDAYSMLLAGASLSGIAREWNRRGLPTPQPDRDGNPRTWQRSQMHRALRKPTHAGLRSHRGEVIGKAAWPALVAEDTWHAAQAILRDPSRARPPAARSLLTAIARCGVCGATVHAGGGAVARRGYRTYRCSGTTGHVVRQADPVDHYVTELAIERLSAPDVMDVLANKARPDTTEMAREAVTLRERLDGIAVDFADGSLTAGQLRTMTARLRGRLATLEEGMAQAHSRDALAPLMGARDAREAWMGMTQEAQRATIDLLMEITLRSPGRGARHFDPATVAVEWRS